MGAEPEWQSKIELQPKTCHPDMARKESGWMRKTLPPLIAALIAASPATGVLAQAPSDPFDRQPWVTSDDIANQVTWTLSNLDAVAHAALDRPPQQRAVPRRP